MFTESMLASMKNVEATRVARLNCQLERMSAKEKEELLQEYHPDYRESGFKTLEVGVNKGDKVPVELAELLQDRTLVRKKVNLNVPVTVMIMH